ncbi:MAG: UbiD family decarboxylase [Candidatus Caldarchaeum sp.]|nr:UbiD family decarboxylase [Candidatus Caldarchaeum sp.]MDW7977496.1 UbiD family decarboxylase [Candidatus Caldarchaeum sp.]MDW8360137.1 UbiD family decarboxylase [Candidatus Caldarchaeum sp.]
MFRDMREYLAALEKKNDLKIIDKQVRTEFEIAAYIRKSSDMNGPAFLFRNIKDHEGWRLAAGLYCTMSKITTALGCEAKDIAKKYREAILNPVEPRVVSSAAFKHKVVKNEDVNLYSIPICKHSERDSAKYITSAVAFAKDPETGVIQMGIHRHELKGRNTLGLWAPGEKRIGRAFLKAEDRGEPLEVALVIGNDPAVDLASQAKVHHTFSKINVAGGLKEKAVELAKCETIDVEVPADAEVVLECEAVPGYREKEGPFGELTGTYSGGKEAPILKVKAVCMRENPIFTTFLTGMPKTDNHYMALPAMMEVVHRYASTACPEVKAVNLTGNGYYTVLVSIRKRMEGEPYNVMAAVLGSIYQTKYCYVFDDDIDVFNPDDVEWAFQTRFQPSEDLHVFPFMVGAPLDPSAPLDRHTSKLGLDCTIPLSERATGKYVRVVVPGVEKVTW